MTDSPDQPKPADHTYDGTRSVADPPVPPPGAHVHGPHHPPPTRPHRLYRVAAWVGIVAGVLLIVVVIFGSGFFLGKQVSRSHDRGDRQHSMFDEMKPVEPPFGRFERRMDEFPRLPGIPMPPDGHTPERPDGTTPPEPGEGTTTPSPGGPTGTPTRPTPTP